MIYIMYSNSMSPVQVSKTSIWDEVKHTLMFINMYLFAGSLSFLLMIYLEIAFNPDSIVNYQTSSIQASIRFILSVLIISYPLFITLFLSIVKQVIKQPQIRHTRSRSFFTYITIAGSAIILIAVFINVVYLLLNRYFVLVNFIPAGIITVVYGTIFIYFFRQAIQDHIHHE